MKQRYINSMFKRIYNTSNKPPVINIKHLVLNNYTLNRDDFPGARFHKKNEPKKKKNIKNSEYPGARRNKYDDYDEYIEKIIKNGGL
tara:strand:- start:554 stop:814 length:261 start_codon:yes stop_codon:yes gene_type:complete